MGFTCALSLFLARQGLLVDPEVQDLQEFQAVLQAPGYHVVQSCLASLEGLDSLATHLVHVGLEYSSPQDSFGNSAFDDAETCDDASISAVFLSHPHNPSDLVAHEILEGLSKWLCTGVACDARKNTFGVDSGTYQRFFSGGTFDTCGVECGTYQISFFAYRCSICGVGCGTYQISFSAGKLHTCGVERGTSQTAVSACKDYTFGVVQCNIPRSFFDGNLIF